MSCLEGDFVPSTPDAEPDEYEYHGCTNNCGPGHDDFDRRCGGARGYFF
jgi:hypothetical protein